MRVSHRKAKDYIELPLIFSPRVYKNAICISVGSSMMKDVINGQH